MTQKSNANAKLVSQVSSKQQCIRKRQKHQNAKPKVGFSGFIKTILNMQKRQSIKNVNPEMGFPGFIKTILNMQNAKWVFLKFHQYNHINAKKKKKKQNITN